MSSGIACIFIDEVPARHLHDRIIIVLDGAGWHRYELPKIPDNLRLLILLPYSPELNPVVHVWDDLREKEFHNRVFDSIDFLEDHLVKALRDFENDQDRIRSIVAWRWIINALTN